MNCEHCREGISARLDGESASAELLSIEAHLATCPPCRRFVDDAAHVTRLARTAVATEVPDVVAVVLAAAPRSRRPSLKAILRVLLGLVGLAQLAVAVSGVLTAQTAGHDHNGIHLEGASLQHFAHESAAWNLALGVGFCWVAWRSSRTSGMVPMVTAFVLVLTMLEVLDLLSGQVDPSRMLAHGMVLLGLVLMIALDRRRRPAGGTLPGGAGSGWTLRTMPETSPTTGVATSYRPPDLRPTAQHSSGAIATRRHGTDQTRRRIA